jgi:hypothetical protein
MFLPNQVIVTASVKLSSHLAREVDFSSQNSTLTPTRHLRKAMHMQTHREDSLPPYSLVFKQKTNAESDFAIIVHSRSTPTLTLMLISKMWSRTYMYIRPSRHKLDSRQHSDI